ncbi:hypothetical protein LTR08_004629 [Meristemomyces frigidus]|nr:hypothetical protein LTR08_004629 [Meristemomyces frigidus]
MEKRNAPGAKPPAATTTRPAAADDAKKPAATSPRPSSSKPPVAPTPARTSALASRTTGSTINKPPTRPVLSSSRKSGTRGSEDAASTTAGSKGENKRPSRMSTIGIASSKDSAEEKSRRTTMGGMTASGAAKRPAMVSRASTASPTKSRMSTTTTAAQPTRPTAEVTTSPKRPRKISSGAGRPASTATIPEESEALDDVPQMVSPKKSTAARPASPQKLEIRSFNSMSDTEALQSKPLSRHSRTQSAHVTGRPSTAPGQGFAVSEQEQTRRDMAIVQSLLRESTKRESLEAELKDLKDEVARLERRNQKLAEAAKASNGDGAELEALRQTHKTALSSLEVKHSKKLSMLRTELADKERSSSRLEGVETKIEAVEKALRESKQSASLNEQELQQTIQQKEQDHDQLARVIADLKQEIDRCQAKLNKDVVKQAKEKKEGIKVTELLRIELEEERTRRKDAADFRERERLDSHESFQTVLKQTRDMGEQEMERLRTAAADAEAASARFQQELESVREQDGEQFEKNQAALIDSTSTIKTLQAEVQKLKGEHLQDFEKQRQRGDENESRADDLRTELTALQQQRTTEKAERKDESYHARIASNELHAKIRQLQQEVGHGNTVADTLQTQLREVKSKHASEVSNMREAAENLRTEYEDLQQMNRDGENKHESELSELRAVVEALQTGNGNLQQYHADVLAQKEELVQARNAIVQSLQGEVTTLQEQLDGAARTNDEAIEALKRETGVLQERHEEQTAAKEKENGELSAVVDELHGQVHGYKQAVEDAKEQADSDHSQVIEGLQTQVQAAQQALHDEEAGRQHAESQLQAVNDAHERLVKQLKGFQEARDDAAKDAEQKGMKIEELLASLADAEAAETSAETSMGSMKEELSGLQKVLDSFEREAGEKEAAHAHGLEQLRRELRGSHESEVEELRQRLGAVERENGDMSELHSMEVERLQKESESRLDEERKAYGLQTADVEERLQGELDLLRGKHGIDKQEADRKERERLIHQRLELEARLHGELNELRGQHEALENLHGDVEEEHEAAVKEWQDLQQQLRSKLDQMREQHVVLERQKGDLEAEHHHELESVRQSHAEAITVLQQSCTKDDRPDNAELHQQEIDQLREQYNVLENQTREHEAQRQSELESHVQEVQALERKSVQGSQPDEELQRKYVDVLQEQRALDKMLDDMETQQDRKIQQLTSKHDIAYRELQQTLEDERGKRAEEAVEGPDYEVAVKGLQAKLEQCQEGYARELAKRIQQLTDQHDTAYHELKQTMEDGREGWAREITQQTQKHDAASSELQKELDRAQAESRELQEALEAEEDERVKVLAESRSEREKASRDLQSKLDHAQDVHARQLMEQNEQHEIAARALEQKLDQVQETQSRQLAEMSQQRDEACTALQDSISRLQQENATASNILYAEHERSVQATMEKHATQVSEVEEAASRRSEAAVVDRDRAHEAALAALEAEHAEALHRATLSPPSNETGDTLAPETPPADLSHVLVGHPNGRESPLLAKTPLSSRVDREERDETPILAETPLAYTSEEEPHYSPTPAYPKGGRRAGGEMAAVRQPEYVQLEKENAGLVAALHAAQAELAAFKTPVTPPKQQQIVQRRPASPMPDREQRPQAPPAYYNEDPFAPHTNGHHVSRSSSRSEWDGNMTLEGTLESIRVQTEQLLEINDDFIAEQRRWSRKLSATRSQRNSPMRAAT